jgi:endonuclease-3 related protein
MSKAQSSQRLGLRTSIEILEALKKSIDAGIRDSWWWPNSGSFEVVVGAILTQQSQWNRVEMALEALRKNEALHVNTLANISHEQLAYLIKPCGFYTQKASRIIRLTQALRADFGDFETFCSQVDRGWLLGQKGIGFESADAILNYACKRETMVVDRYTAILLSYYGYEFESYDQIQSWLVEGMDEGVLMDLYGQMSKAQIYARFHGKIVEFCKGKIKKGSLTKGVPGLSPE